MKPLTFAVLRILSDGEFHSVEKLAAQLSVSRADIRHALRPFVATGLTLHAVRGRGYRLIEPIEWLDLPRIRAQTKALGNELDIRLIDSVDSTNRELARQLEGGSARHGSILAAEWQSAGRGRYGRRWEAGLGQGLMFSLAWRFDSSVGFLSGLSLAAGIAVVRALHALGIGDVELKWPNDVLRKKRKLAGALIELSGDALGPSMAIIGIGLNVSLPDAIKSQIDQPAVDLQEGAVRLSRNAVFAGILNDLVDVLVRFAKHGFSLFRDEWQGYHAFQNQNVCLALPDGAAECGVALGVTPQGALRLLTATGEKLFYSGELSLPFAWPARNSRLACGTK